MAPARATRATRATKAAREPSTIFLDRRSKLRSSRQTESCRESVQASLGGRRVGSLHFEGLSKRGVPIFVSCQQLLALLWAANLCRSSQLNSRLA